MSDWRDDEVRNEAHSRDRNEWIEDARGPNGDEGAAEVYVCECGDAACTQRILLTRSEYEEVRGYATRFAVALHHENPEIDQVVSEGGRYAVVQKIAGMPARIARQTDPRRAGIGS
jgi:hypothetical protein